jgi:hypothetical protein
MGVAYGDSLHGKNTVFERVSSGNVGKTSGNVQRFSENEYHLFNFSDEKTI